MYTAPDGSRSATENGDGRCCHIWDGHVARHSMADQPLEQWILFSTIHQLGCPSLYTPPAPRDALFGLRMLAPPPSL